MGRFDDKTERPTARRRSEARKEGQVAKSQEVAVAASLIAAIFMLRLIAPVTMSVFARRSRDFFTAAGTGELPVQLLREGVLELAVAGIVPFLGVALFAGITANVAQVGFKITPKAARPRLSKINPKQGFERLRLSNAGWELLRVFLKLALLTVVVWGPISDFIDSMTLLRSLGEGLRATIDVVFTILFRAVALMTVIAAADWGVNKYKHERQMKMTKEEVKQEHKQQEGDPRIKAVRRRRAAEMSRNRILAAVAEADVVVTNPTHFAVALSYLEAEGAPKVVAKGTDKLAARIRREAYRNGVMVTENKPLARALYRRVRVGDFIPADLYQAVAIVLATVYRRRERLRARVSGTPTAQVTPGSAA